MHRVSSPMPMKSLRIPGESSHDEPKTVRHLDPVSGLLWNLQLFGAFTDVDPTHSGRRRWLALERSTSPVSSLQYGRLGDSGHGVWPGASHVLALQKRVLGGSAEAMIGGREAFGPTTRKSVSLRRARSAMSTSLKSGAAGPANKATPATASRSRAGTFHHIHSFPARG